MKVLSRREWMFLAFVFIYSFIPTFGGLFRIVELAGGSAIVPQNPRAIAYPLPIILHIIGSFLFCVLGAIQFLPGMRRWHPGLHRKMGRVIAVSGILSALTGLWMTIAFAFPPELQGVLLYWVRIILSISMVGLIAWAVIAVRSGNIAGHGSAMLRAYAIGQGASTQAVLGIGWIAVVGTEPLGPLRDVLMVSAWGINLMVAEFLIARIFGSRPPVISGVRHL